MQQPSAPPAAKVYYPAAVLPVGSMVGPLYDAGSVLELDHKHTVLRDLAFGLTCEPRMAEDGPEPGLSSLLLPGKQPQGSSTFRATVPDKWVVLGGQWLVVAPRDLGGVTHAVYSDAALLATMDHHAARAFALAAGRTPQHCVPLGQYGGTVFQWLLRAAPSVPGDALPAKKLQQARNEGRVQTYECPLHVMMPHGAVGGMALGLEVSRPGGASYEAPSEPVKAWFLVTRAVRIVTPSTLRVRVPTWCGQPVFLGTQVVEGSLTVASTLAVNGCVCALWIGPGPGGVVPHTVVLQFIHHPAYADAATYAPEKVTEFRFAVRDKQTGAWEADPCVGGVLVSLAPTPSQGDVHTEWFKHRRSVCFSRVEHTQLLAHYRKPLPVGTILPCCALTCSAAGVIAAGSSAMLPCFDMAYARHPTPLPLYAP